MPFFGRHRGEPRPLPFDPASGRTRRTCRPDHGGRRTDLRHRSRGPVARANPDSLPLRRHIGCPMAVPPRPRRSADPTSVAGDPRPDRPPKRTPLPELVLPVAGCPARGAPDAVHADPVARAIALRRPVGSRARQLGCRARGRPGTSSPDAPVARFAVPRSTVASCPVPEPLHLVDRTRRHPPPTRRSVSDDPVVRSRLACAFRYVQHSREHETPGQEAFLNPQGYPPNFPAIPRISPIVHREFTGATRVFPTVVHRGG